MRGSTRSLRGFGLCLILLASLLLGACGDKSAPSSGFAGLGQEAGDFNKVERGRVLQFPVDHGQHDGYRIEWWYITANLKDEAGQDWGVQWTLFRSALRPGQEQAGWNSPNVWMGHAALSSPNGHQFAETLARGGVGQAGVEAQPFKAWIDDWALQSTGGEGIDQLQMRAAGKDFRYQLELLAQGPLVQHGDQGYSEKSGQGQASYYYSQPFYQVKGEVERDGKKHRVRGQAWLDREWSSQPLSKSQQGWDWFSLHLDSGAKVMLFQVRQSDGKPYRAGTWITPDGKAQPLRGDQILLTDQATTTQDNQRKVPTRWRVQIPDFKLDVQTEAIQPRAWMGTSFAYWEGPVSLTGSAGGRGYLEMTGY
ncbi:iron ABC transporter permease [Pigmentiphaga aceris]|uniref:Iron ABC transporter permease n=2 Tax=Pigmentiphaga aceris TaxID=1940612 RepID=A0A5C0B4U6_9BURK|nr:iron ABC transporter permease [Pigmentiphaga aceris]